MFDIFQESYVSGDGILSILWNLDGLFCREGEGGKRGFVLLSTAFFFFGCTYYRESVDFEHLKRLRVETIKLVPFRQAGSSHFPCTEMSSPVAQAVACIPSLVRLVSQSAQHHGLERFCEPLFTIYFIYFFRRESGVVHVLFQFPVKRSVPK